jgi:hypothetical protein
VKQLNGMDALLLYSETPNLHTHTLKVAIVDAADYDGEFTFELFGRRCGAGCIGCNRCATGFSTFRGDCIIRCGWRTATLTSTITCDEWTYRLLADGESSTRSSARSPVPH